MDKKVEVAAKGQGGIVLGPPSSTGGDGARQHLWWDYEIIATRALGVSSLAPLWPRDWAAVVHVAMGAAAASRLVYLGVDDVASTMTHPYIKRQVALGRVAVYVGDARGRHGASPAEIASIRRSLLSLAHTQHLPALETLDEAKAWRPGA